MQRKRPFGPGLLVAAAFIGPGTVTTASVAGAQFGFALVWSAVVLLGTGLAFLGQQPLVALLLAQAVNACLLPFLAGCLLFVMNKQKLLGAYTNGTLANMAGGAVVLIVTGLGVFQFFRVWGVLPS